MDRAGLMTSNGVSAKGDVQTKTTRSLGLDRSEGGRLPFIPWSAPTGSAAFGALLQLRWDHPSPWRWGWSWRGGWAGMGTLGPSGPRRLAATSSLASIQFLDLLLKASRKVLRRMRPAPWLVRGFCVVPLPPAPASSGALAPIPGAGGKKHGRKGGWRPVGRRGWLPSGLNNLWPEGGPGEAASPDDERNGFRLFGGLGNPSSISASSPDVVIRKERLEPHSHQRRRPRVENGSPWIGCRLDQF